MIKEVYIDNFKTFMKPTIIDFAATNYKFLEKENLSENRLLKGLLFVGENASGKTQILKSICFLLDMLFGNTEEDFLTAKCFFSPKESFNLKYVFIVSSKEIVYDIEIDIKRIVKEKLIIDDKIIIDRIGNSATFNYNDSKVYEDLSDKLLFLRRIYFDTHFYDDKILNKWYDYLKNSVYINCYNREIKSYNNKKLLAHDYLDENNTKKINDFFKQINYKQEIKFDNNTNNSDTGLNVKSNEKFVSFRKEGTNTYIPEMFESTGNITLIHLLPTFIHAINNECLLIIDEFSSGFHNELEECLIKYFNYYAKGSQIIFSSHSTNILNNTILRPDQIYSACFNSKEGTVLKRFSDEMPREAQNTEKMYLNGVFGGLPRYNKEFKD